LPPNDAKIFELSGGCGTPPETEKTKGGKHERTASGRDVTLRMGNPGNLQKDIPKFKTLQRGPMSNIKRKKSRTQA